jgi:hypothetical protein
VLAVSQGWRGPAPAGRAAGGCADRYGAGRGTFCGLSACSCRGPLPLRPEHRKAHNSRQRVHLRRWHSTRAAECEQLAASRRLSRGPALLAPVAKQCFCSRDHKHGTANCAASTPAKRSCAAASSPSGPSTTHNCAHIGLTLPGSRRTLFCVCATAPFVCAQRARVAEQRNKSTAF